MAAIKRFGIAGLAAACFLTAGLLAGSPAAAFQAGETWPDLLYGTWTGTICGKPITYIIYPSVVTTSEGYGDPTPDNSSSTHAIGIRSKYTRDDGEVRYDQYSVAPDTQENWLYGDAVEGVAYANNVYVTLTYDPDRHDLYGTYFAPGAVCQDVDITKQGESLDPELDKLTDEDFYHLFDSL